jgi:hypothetical protein
MHEERLKLWNEFNTCWLAVLQRQKDFTIEIQSSGQRQHQSALLEYDQMETMGKELIRLCDVMEKHGLVDYQMGVWEEEIITRKSRILDYESGVLYHTNLSSVLTQCLDLLEEGTTAPIVQATTSRRR